MNETTNPNPPTPDDDQQGKVGEKGKSIGGNNSNQRQGDEKRAGNDAKNEPRKIDWKKVRILAAWVAFIEAASLFLWQEAEDFIGYEAAFIHWVSKCGILAGGAFVLQKITAQKFLIWVPFACLCIAFGAVGFINTANFLSSTDESGNPTGLLRPAFDPVPDIVKSSSSILPEKANFLIYGQNVIAVVGNKSTISAIEYNGVSFLKIGVSDRKAFVSAYFFGTDGKIVAIIETNRFTLNRLNFFRKFSDKSTLTVFDQQNTEILNIRFLRPNMFQIRGIFRLPNMEQVDVTEHGLVYESSVYIGNVSFSSGGVDIERNRVIWGKAFIN